MSNTDEIRAYVGSLSSEDQATVTAEAASEQANEKLKRQPSMTIPITANFLALMFVSLADLIQEQQQVLTSLIAHRNLPL